MSTKEYICSSNANSKAEESRKYRIFVSKERFFGIRRMHYAQKAKPHLCRCGMRFHAFDPGLTSQRSGIGALATGTGSTAAGWRGRFHTDSKSGELPLHVGSSAFRTDVYVLGIGFFQNIRYFPTVFTAVLEDRHSWRLLLWFSPG